MLTRKVVVASLLVGLGVGAMGGVASADCQGCTAAWGLYKNGDGVTGKRHNSSTEIIDDQDFHGALMKTNSCGNYDNFIENTMNADYPNISTTPDVGTAPRRSSSGGQLWIWAGGHHWWDDFTDYNVSTADACQQAQNMVSG